MRVRLAAATVLFAVAAGLTSGAIALAGEPTPTPEPSATAEPTPGLAANQMVVRVIQDLNGDGLPQNGEPPINGVQVTGGCADGLSGYTTAVDGSAVVFFDSCFRVERRFGWFPTTPAFVRLPDDYERSRILYFTVQDFGDDVMELQGEAIIAGLPAVDPTFSQQTAPFGDCAYAYYESSTTITAVTVVVLGAPQRAGCPAPGDAFTITMRTEVGPPVTFSPGSTLSHPFVASGDSMRLSVYDVSNASVFDVATATITENCAVVVPYTGFVAPGSARIFVLSDEVRPGCGAPGRGVLFLRDGKPLDPTLEWQPGTPQFSPPLVFVERSLDIGIDAPDTGGNQVTPPDTGSGGYR